MRSLLFIALIFSFPLIAQQLDVNGTVSASGIFSSEDAIPFWMHANTNTELGPFSNYSGTGDLNGVYHFDNATIEAGAAFFYRDDVTDEFQRRDLFLRYRNNWLKVTVGAKRQDVLLDGLSATNQNFLWSSNARPLPGLVIEANEPIRISETFGLDWGIGHYSLNDTRYVDNVRVHYKRLGLIVNFNEYHQLRMQIQHFAQWAGTSPVVGELKNDFSAFVDVFFARKTTEIFMEGEIQNAVGNHLGSYLLEYDFSTEAGDFTFYHEHPFEDGSGTRFANFPDGVWGASFKPENNDFISRVVYEYIDTSDQSASSTSGFDNYFNNDVYRSGWTYDGTIIGLPFIITDPTIAITENTAPIVSNRVQLHHLGVAGRLYVLNWQLKTSVSRNLGTFINMSQPVLNNWYNYISLSYASEDYGVFTLMGGADFSNVNATVAGGGVSYRYSF